ncbi:hypothetical protein C1752_01886 [Acaryochloris thomasi RCC1774]|uniref:Uncharacterized protein n=1 Tax=Acaryochloris thomasi RCC1774 TaxID=1764569 RepID=A0A2W1JYQ2_9CYAN|nr:hypothetical protein [Acaryochloris thomasi]PZD73651.1 hypothetical protein C1752_01886 [Acaryochloris thomasi RCC1774]
MKTKFTSFLYTALAVTVLSGTNAIAQPSPSEAPNTTGPADESEQVDPDFPAEPAAPESEPLPEEADPGVATSSITSDGSNSLVTCGPNGAAFIVAEVSPGCHVLKANSPPGQSTNAE